MRAPFHRIHLTAMVLLAWSMIALPSFADRYHIEALKKPPVRIDFNDVVEDDTARLNEERRDALRIAVAAMTSPKYTYQYYDALLNLIGDLMDRKIIFIQKKTYAEVNEMIKEKELDMAFVCSGPYVSGKREFGMEIIAVPLCHGEKVYYSYFITPKEGGVRSFDELRGKIFAFTDPLSNTGYMVPVYYLTRRNETPESFFSKTFFTHSHDRSIEAVARGLADGAAVDSLIYDFMKLNKTELTEKTTVIEKSPPYGIPPVVVSPEMEPEMKKKLKRVFLSIHENQRGKAILAKLRIDRFIEGNDEDYNTVRELENFLQSCRLKKEIP